MAAGDAGAHDVLVRSGTPAGVLLSCIYYILVLLLCTCMHHTGRSHTGANDAGKHDVLVRSGTLAGVLLSTFAGLLVTGVHDAQVYFGAPACTLVTLVMLQRGILYEVHWLSHGEANGEGKLDSIELPKQTGTLHRSESSYKVTTIRFPQHLTDTGIINQINGQLTALYISE